MTISSVTVPRTLAEAQDPQWLEGALAPVIGKAKIHTVTTVEVIRTMATKIRFTVEHDHGTEALCLKAFLDVDAENAMGGPTMVREADFYDRIAPRTTMRLAECVVKIIDRGAQEGVIIMRDLVDGGATMWHALIALNADDVRGTLEQLAALHATKDVLDTSPWIVRRISQMAERPHLTLDTVQQLLDGERGADLPADVANAERLLMGLQELAKRDSKRPQFLIHGDCHAGNIFRTQQGPGLLDWQLIQRGGWALDVAYNINALLPVDIAEKEEIDLLRHYLDFARGLGLDLPPFDEALSQYREAVIYGYYLWVITRRVDPKITNICNNRLGMAVARNESHRILNIF